MTGARAPRVRWVMILVPVGIYFFSYFHRIAPAVVVEDVMVAFGATGAMIGLLTAIYPWLFATMALPAGTLADTLGPRWTLTAGGALMAVGSMAFGLAPTFNGAFGGRLLVGLGSSVILIAWLRLGSAWCRPDELARLAGLSQTVGSIGGLVGTAPLALLVAALGWRTSFVAIGGLTAVVAATSGILIRDRPEAMGLPPIVDRPPPAPAMALGELARGVRAVLGNPHSWPPVLVGGGVYSTFVTFLGLWGVPYLSHVYGIDRLEASRYTAWAALGTIVGAISVGWLSDRVLGRRRLPMIVLAAAYAGVWCLLALPDSARLPLPALRPLCFLLGFASSVVAIVFAVVPEVNDPARPGVAIGLCNVPSFTLLAALQWVTGAMLDAGWRGQLAGARRVYPFAAYHAVWALCAALAIGSALIAWWVRETRCRNVWTRPR
ncbi:MAG: MFS transporter [Candidatus Rokubacteria bacterium]|nr:MFS transporter [Candidatus Rokubacteria bacterium]